MKTLALTALGLLLTATPAWAQTKVQVPQPDSKLTDVRTTNFPRLKEMINVPVPGAPLLSDPVRIDGTKKEIRTELHGLIYPCFYDWDKDGKPDLLLGEFETGMPGVRVYINKGTREKPKYTGDFFYATDVKGDTLQTHQWCCIGFHPQVIDVDGDGYDDIISGQYNPGLISWWRGSAEGFQPRQFIDQLYLKEGNDGKGSGFSGIDPTSVNYWNYTTARLADFNGDGLPDLFVGGTGGYRVALNIGTKDKPKFGKREYLYHLDGTILHTYRDPKVDVNKRFVPYEACGDDKAMLTPVDWDGDGVLDILATVSYTQPEQDGIYFFRGVRTQDGLRFEQARPLVVAKDGGKLFPGTCPQIYVCDYNNDGVNDLLLGLSIATVNGLEADDYANWHWIHDMGINFPGKDAGRNFEYYPEPDSLFAEMEREPWRKQYLLGKLTDMKYVTLRHRGYPFIMYGRKNPLQAVALPGVAMRKEYVVPDIPEALVSDKSVDYYVDVGNKYLMPNNPGAFIHVHFVLRDGYHLYTPAAVNRDFIPTSVELELPEGLEWAFGQTKMGEPQKVMLGMNEVYKGEQPVFSGAVKADFSKFPEKSTVNVKVKVKYQACNDHMCLPPVEEEHTVVLTIDPNK